MLVFAALIVAVLAVPGYFSFSSLQERIAEQKEQVKDLQQAIDASKKANDESTRLIDKLQVRIEALSQAKTVQETTPPRSPDKSQTGATR